MFEKCRWSACLCFVFFFFRWGLRQRIKWKILCARLKKKKKENHILGITEVSESRQQSSILVRTDHCSNYKLQHELETKISLNDTNLSIPTEYITWEKFPLERDKQKKQKFTKGGSP